MMTAQPKRGHLCAAAPSGRSGIVSALSWSAMVFSTSGLRIAIPFVAMGVPSFARLGKKTAEPVYGYTSNAEKALGRDGNFAIDNFRRTSRQKVSHKRASDCTGPMVQIETSGIFANCVVKIRAGASFKHRQLFGFAIGKCRGR